MTIINQTPLTGSYLNRANQDKLLKEKFMEESSISYGDKKNCLFLPRVQLCNKKWYTSS